MRYLFIIFFFLFTYSCKTTHDFYTSKSEIVEKKLRTNGCGCFAQMVKDHFFYDNRREHYVFGRQLGGKLMEGPKVYEKCLFSLTEEDFKALFGLPQIQEKNTLRYFYSINNSGGSYNAWNVIINDVGFVSETNMRTYSNKVDFDTYRHLRKPGMSAKLYFEDESKLRVVQKLFEPFDKETLKKSFKPADFIVNNRPLYENDTIPYLCLKCLQYRQQNWYRNTRTGIYILNTTQARFPFISGIDFNAKMAACTKTLGRISENKEMLKALFGKPDIVSSQKDTLVYYMNAISDRDTLNRSFAYYRKDSTEKYQPAWVWRSKNPDVPRYECAGTKDSP